MGIRRLVCGRDPKQDGRRLAAAVAISLMAPLAFGDSEAETLGVFERQIDMLTRSLEHFREENERLRGDVREAKERIRALESDRPEEILRRAGDPAFREQAELLNRALQRAREEADRTREEIDSLRRREAESTAEKDSLRNRVRVLETAVLTESNRLATARNEIDLLVRRAESARDDAAALRVELERLRDRARQDRLARMAHSNETAAAQGRVEDAVARLKQALEESEAVRLDNERLRNLVSVMSEELAAEGKLQTAIEQLERNQASLREENDRLRRESEAGASPAQAAERPREIAEPPRASGAPAALAAPAAGSAPGGLFQRERTEPVRRGNALLGEGRIDAAEDLFREALADDPQDFDAQLGLSSCLYMRGDLPQASASAEDLASVRPDDPNLLGLRGLIAWRQGRLGRARQLLSRALEGDPSSARFHNYLGVVHYASGRTRDAEESFVRAIEIDSELEEAYFNLAVLFANSDAAGLNQARSFYEHAIQLGRSRHHELEKILYR
jgi:Flp pilus assembly protein TadD/predicted  nucleic acid-binding Zn-ribbon protein